MLVGKFRIGFLLIRLDDDQSITKIKSGLRHTGRCLTDPGYIKDPDWLYTNPEAQESEDFHGRVRNLIVPNQKQTARFQVDLWSYWYDHYLRLWSWHEETRCRHCFLIYWCLVIRSVMKQKSCVPNRWWLRLAWADFSSK